MVSSEINNFKIDPAVLAFDVDGVCADTMRLFLDILQEEFGINRIRYEDITSYSLENCLNLDSEIIRQAVNKILDGDHRAVLKPIPGAIKVLEKIGKRHDALIFVTARPHPEPIKSWLQQQLNLDPQMIDVIATGAFDAKPGVLLEKNISFFVEDRLDTCFPISEAGITPILYCQPWNREIHPFTEINNWEELEILLDL